jgi:hypothetical protein
VLRLLGLVYLVAFGTLVVQGPGLLGSAGITPAAAFLDDVAQAAGSRSAAAWELPTLFWLGAGDDALRLAGWSGVALAALLLGGWGNAVSLAVLWATHFSVTQIGQRWYGFGWEMQLAETGFLAIFLVDPWDARPFPRTPPPRVVIGLLRWLIVRVMLGAGLVKLRGDACWTDFTCLMWHYETQPIPNPVSRWLHFQPALFHRAGVGFTHAVELVAPWFAFGPRRARIAAGAAMVALQLLIVVSGNLSYLNWLTLVPCLACFDDGVWARILPRRLVRRAVEAARTSRSCGRARRGVVGALLVAVALLSIAPIANLLSPRQRMNASFDRFELVNSYGAFGSVGQERYELEIQATLDEQLGPETAWSTYEFPCKPGDPGRAPCWMSPWHRRLDWLMWFAAMGPPLDSPWFAGLLEGLFDARPAVLALLAHDPLAGRRPAWIRVLRRRYRFAPAGSGTWWERGAPSLWLRPIPRQVP